MRFSFNFFVNIFCKNSPEAKLSKLKKLITKLSFRFREVLFEIAQSDEDHGKFFVAAKFFGVSMEKVTLVFQVSFFRSFSFITYCCNS